MHNNDDFPSLFQSINLKYVEIIHCGRETSCTSISNSNPFKCHLISSHEIQCPLTAERAIEEFVLEIAFCLIFNVYLFNEIY